MTPEVKTSERNDLVETGSHEFVISDYSSSKGIGTGKHIASDNFTAGGYQRAIYFYPDGKRPEDNSVYVSAYIALVSEGTDVQASFELCLVDQSGKEKHKVHLGLLDFCKPYTLKHRGSMWGYERLYRRDMLESSDYLRNDGLRIKCKVYVYVAFSP